jgi:hypothetical protein
MQFTSPLKFDKEYIMVRVNYGPMTEMQMNPDEIESVTAAIKDMGSDGLMVEWGSGASTVKWLETMTDNQRLISIEHNPEWHMKVNQYLVTRPEINSRLKYFFKPELYGYQHGYGVIGEEHPHGMDDYYFPRKDILDADVFFIDGVARATTSILVKMLSTKADPVIYIHDYYGREQWYAWATQFFSKKEKAGQTLVRLWK